MEQNRLKKRAKIVQELGLFDIQRAQQQTGQPLCEARIRRSSTLRYGQPRHAEIRGTLGSSEQKAGSGAVRTAIPGHGFCCAADWDLMEKKSGLVGTVRAFEESGLSRKPVGQSNHRGEKLTAT
jgi:hypothetical protein